MLLYVIHYKYLKIILSITLKIKLVSKILIISA